MELSPVSGLTVVRSGFGRGFLTLSWAHLEYGGFFSAGVLAGAFLFTRRISLVDVLQFDWPLWNLLFPAIPLLVRRNRPDLLVAYVYSYCWSYVLGGASTSITTRRWRCVPPFSHLGWRLKPYFQCSVWAVWCSLLVHLGCLETHPSTMWEMRM